MADEPPREDPGGESPNRPDQTRAAGGDSQGVSRTAEASSSIEASMAEATIKSE